MSLKPIENGLIQTGNGIIFTTYSPPFKKLLLPYSNQEGFLNHHVLFAEDCDHFDHMKQDCTTLSNNKSVTCKTLCHVLFFIFLFDFFNLYSPLYSCTISFNSSRSGGGVLLNFAMQVDFLMASGCLLIIISPNSLRWSSNHLLISNKILSQGLKVFWLLYYQISPQNLPYWNTRKAYLRGELFDKGGGVILHGVPYGINVLLKWSWFLLALEVFQCEHYLSP